jgi:hypothetical protein
MLDENNLSRLMVAEVEDGERPSTVLDVERAITTGRRRRRIGRGLVVGGVLSVVAAVAVAVPTIADTLAGSGKERSAAPPPTSVVTAYSGIHDPAVDMNNDPAFDKMSPAHNYSLLLDPRTGTYQRVPYPTVVPSPDAQRVLVWKGDNSVRYPLRVGILDRATESVRWVADDAVPLGRLSAGSDGVWSPDGSRILFTVASATVGDGVGILDTGTLEATFVALPELAENNAAGLAAVWTPDGTGFTLPLTHIESERGRRFSAIRTWDLTGTVRSNVAVSYDTDVEAVDWSFSPDRSLLAVTHANGINLIDARTGVASSTVTTPVGSRLAGWRDTGHLLTVTTDREAEPAHILQVVTLTGHVVKTGTLAASPQRFHIGPAVGLPGNAVTF